MTVVETLIALAIYFAPAIIAFFRHKHNLRNIFLVDLLLGWMVVGWVFALA